MMNESRTTPDSSAKAPYAEALPTSRGFAWLLLAAGTVGITASFILITEKIRLLEDPSYITSCDVNPWISCGQVMQRWQSELFGFPNPLIGLVGFAVIITTGVVLLADALPARWFWGGLQIGITAGSAFAVWLWSQALFDIHILCLYCVVVWAAMIPLAISITIRNAEHNVIPLPAAIVRFLVSWQGTIIILMYVITGGSVLITFLPSML
jgi:uncharacterized membrane protein